MSEIVADQIFSSSIRLSWENDPAWEGSPTPTVVIPEKLVLAYSDETGVIGEKDIEISQNFIVVENLEADKAYTFEMRAVYSFGRSD